MTFVPHYRLSMLGTIGSDEQFSCSISLEPQGPQWQTLFTDVTTKEASLIAWRDEIEEGKYTDLVADCVAWFGRQQTHLTSVARLRRIKFATIGANGKYAASPREFAVDQAGYHNVVGFPFQVARKATLLTNGDLNRVKGGFYMPCPSLDDFDRNTNLWSVEHTAQVQESTLQLVEDINNDPGLDDDGFRVVVASQGRHNADGTVRRPPTNHDVVGVNIGRRPDIQRRRANKISESRIASAFL